MNIQLITIGTQMPSWVQQGFQEYIKRLPHHVQFQLIEISQKKYHAKISVEKVQQEETQLILTKIPKKFYPIALDRSGEAISSEKLASKLHNYQQQSLNLALLIGGPEGFSPEISHSVKERWSLSQLTFPHPLVRVLLAEQIYRAFSLLAGHPYHR